MMEDNEAKKQIRSIIGVLFFSIFFGFAVVALLLNVYSPTGRYIAGNVLLSPNVAKVMGIPVGNTVQKVDSYDRIEMHYYDPRLRKREEKQVDLDRYGNFYQAVARQESIPSQEVSQAFQNPNIVSLLLFVKTQNGETRIFQQIQVAPTMDAFRVSLHGQLEEGQQPWAYFKYPDVYELVRDL